MWFASPEATVRKRSECSLGSILVPASDEMSDTQVYVLSLSSAGSRAKAIRR